MTYRTFHFETPAEAAAFCDREGLPVGEIMIVDRDASGFPRRCQISVPADVWSMAA